MALSQFCCFTSSIFLFVSLPFCFHSHVSQLVAHTLVQAFADYAYPEGCVLKEVCFVTMYNGAHNAFESYFKDKIIEMMGARRQTAAQLITQM